MTPGRVSVAPGRHEARPARASRDLHPLTFDLPGGFDRRVSPLRVAHGVRAVCVWDMVCGDGPTKRHNKNI